MITTTPAANTAKTTGGAASLVIDAYETDGGTSIQALATSNSNMVAFRNGTTTRWMVDIEGDVFSPTTNAHVAFVDDYDDAQLIRALDHVKSDVGDKGMIRERWDDFVKYNEQDLLDTGVLGAPLSEGGFTNTTQLQRLHNGAIWQGYVRQQEMQEKIDTLENRLLAIEGAK